MDNSNKDFYPDFSCFEDELGYNETFSIDSEMIISIFKTYIDDRKTIIEETLDSVEPHFCQSIDATFNTSTRTKLSVDENGVSQQIPQTSMIFSMNGTGQVYSFYL